MSSACLGFHSTVLHSAVRLVSSYQRKSQIFLRFQFIFWIEGYYTIYTIRIFKLKENSITYPVEMFSDPMFSLDGITMFGYPSLSETIISNVSFRCISSDWNFYWNNLFVVISSSAGPGLGPHGIQMTAVEHLPRIIYFYKSATPHHTPWTTP